MRLLHVAPSYLPAYRYGGLIYSVHGLCWALAVRGHDVQVFTTNVDGPGDSDVPLGVPVELNGVKVWYFPSRRLRRLYWSPAMGRALKAQAASFDLLHLHSIYLWPTWAAARAARQASVPYILAPHGMLVQDLIRRKSRWVKSAWIRLIERRNLEQAAALHLTSAAEAEACRAFGFRLPPLVVVPYGVNLPAADIPGADQTHASPFAGLGGILDEQPLILFLGRVNWEKGLDRLLQALVRVPGADLAIAGNDEEDYTPVLAALAAELGIADRVHFLGLVQGAAKEWLFRRAALMVLPSYSENFGNVVLEALARRCPVVVTPEVGLAGFVQEAGAGLVAAGDPKPLAAAIRKLLADPARREQMGAAGEQAVREQFAWEAVAEQMEAAYQRMMRARSRED